MNKNCRAMAGLAEELVGEFLFLMSKRRRSDLERFLLSGCRATNRLV